MHTISLTMQGEFCSLCFRLEDTVGTPATHKVGEEIPFDDPYPNRHNLTTYVCCRHFRALMGSAAPCAEVDPLAKLKQALLTFASMDLNRRAVEAITELEIELKEQKP